MQSSTQQVFEELFRDQENNFCFECGTFWSFEESLI